MKKKIFSAFVLIGIGGLLMATGYLMGGKPQALAIGPVFGFHNHGKTLYNRKRIPVSPINETVLTRDCSQIKRLFADISYASLEIIPHNEDEFTYAVSNNTDKIGASVEIKHDTLYIKTKKPRKISKWFHIDLGDGINSQTAITVKIPAHFTFETVDITSGVGELLLDGFNAQKAFELTTGIAEAEVSNITASNVKIQTGIGETEFKNCAFTDTVMQTGLGEMTFEGDILKKLDLDSGVGSTDLRINGAKDEYTLNIDSGIGQVMVDGRRFGSFGNSVRMDGSDADNEIHIKAGIGEVNISFQDWKK